MAVLGSRRFFLAVSGSSGVSRFWPLSSLAVRGVLGSRVVMFFSCLVGGRGLRKGGRI